MNHANRIAITGADGFLASRLIEHLRGSHEIVGLARQDLDITSPEATLAKFRALEPQVVIHAAAISDTAACEREPEPSRLVNVAGSIHVARACAAVGAKLIHLSSDQVFNGNPESGPYDEAVLPLPNTAYGTQKHEAEQAVQNETDAVILRLTWLFDFPQRGKRTHANLLWKIVLAAMQASPLTLPAHEYRGITYVHDLVERFDRLIGLPAGIFHAGSENSWSTYETGVQIMENMGLSHRISDLLRADSDRFRDRARDLRIHSSSLASHGVAFPSTAEGIRRCIADYFGFRAGR